MEYKWLNKNNNKKIIIFFNGWGMDENVIKHLDVEDFDLLMFYDYNSLDTNFDFQNLNQYNDRFLVSWSMGVMCATLFPINVTKSVAINGTLYPIDEKYGINPKIYDLTIKGFNEKGRERFIKTMFYPTLENLPDINRDLENQKSELSALKNYKSNEDFEYNKVLISNNDKIIPTKNQSEFWKQEANLNAGHCPFYLFKKWSELL